MRPARPEAGLIAEDEFTPSMMGAIADVRWTLEELGAGVVRAGRRRRPQRPLPRRLPPARAHADEAGLPRRRAASPSPANIGAHGRDRRARRLVRRRRDGRLPGGPAPAAGEADATRRAQRGRLADHPREPPDAQVDLGRPPRDDRLARTSASGGCTRSARALRRRRDRRLPTAARVLASGACAPRSRTSPTASTRSRT